MPGQTDKKELDSFWNLDELLPSKKAQAPGTDRTQNRVESVDLCEINVPAPDAAPKASSAAAGIPPKGTIPDEKAGGPINRFTPADSLIREVAVYDWKSNYSYYEQFCVDAGRLYGVRGEPDLYRTPTEFFSYVPQYSQLTRAQLAFYLSWRRAVREEGIYPPAEYSFVLLYVYEIINLGNRIDPRVGLEQLCGIWNGYRRDYPRLDKLLSEWVIDYCLSHSLSAADVKACPITPEMIGGCTLCEFYVLCDLSRPEDCARALIRYCSNYDFHRSKFAVGDNLALYETHIPAALAAVLSKREQGDLILHNARLREMTVTRDAFVGALCSHRIKKRFEIRYCSFSRSHELRFLISDLVKFAENLLRARIGIKSRLGITAIPDEMKKTVNAYFEAAVPYRSGAARDEDKPHEYDALYDLPKKDFSTADAKRIERESWQTTEALVEAFTEEESDVGTVTAEPVSEAKPETSTEGPLRVESPDPFGSLPEGDTKDFLEAIGPHRAFLRAIADGNVGDAKKYCREAGLLPDRVAEVINNAALDTLGDILLEEADGFWSVPEEYRGDELLDWEDV